MRMLLMGKQLRSAVVLAPVLDLKVPIYVEGGRRWKQKYVGKIKIISPLPSADHLSGKSLQPSVFNIYVMTPPPTSHLLLHPVQSNY